MFLLPAAAPVRLLPVEDAGAQRRSRDLGLPGLEPRAGSARLLLLSECDDDRPGAVPRPDGASTIEILAAALTDRREMRQSALEGADLAGAVGVP